MCLDQYRTLYFNPVQGHKKHDDIVVEISFCGSKVIKKNNLIAYLLSMQHMLTFHFYPLSLSLSLSLFTTHPPSPY